MKNKKLLRAAAALLLVGVVGVASVGCSFELEQPNWVTQALCDHVFDEEEVLKEATCTEDGKIQKTCSDCGKTKITTVKATGHDVVEDEAVEGTCTTPGLTAGSHCTACGEVIVSQKETLGHIDENNDGKCDLCDVSIFDVYSYTVVEVQQGDKVSPGWYSLGYDYIFAKEEDVEYITFKPYTMDFFSICIYIDSEFATAEIEFSSEPNGEGKFFMAYAKANLNVVVIEQQEFVYIPELFFFVHNFGSESEEITNIEFFELATGEVIVSENSHVQKIVFD